MAKNYNASENSTNKNSYGSNKRMLKMLPARISQIKIQAIKMHPVKIRLTGMQRMHMNQTVMHMTAQSPAITKVISIKKCKAVKNGKAAVWIPLLFCFWCSNLVP